MTLQIKQVWNPVAVNEQLTGPNGAVTRDLLRRGTRVQAVAKRKCPANFGRLRGSIELQLGYSARTGEPTVAMRVGSNVSYALHVHNGTGIYGPQGTPIVPTQGRYLVFTIKGGPRRDTHGRFIAGSSRASKVVFAKQVKGQPGVPYLKEALIAAL